MPHKDILYYTGSRIFGRYDLRRVQERRYSHRYQSETWLYFVCGCVSAFTAAFTDIWLAREQMDGVDKLEADVEKKQVLVTGKFRIVRVFMCVCGSCHRNAFVASGGQKWDMATRPLASYTLGLWRLICAGQAHQPCCALCVFCGRRLMHSYARPPAPKGTVDHEKVLKKLNKWSKAAVRTPSSLLIRPLSLSHLSDTILFTLSREENSDTHLVMH